MAFYSDGSGNPGKLRFHRQTLRCPAPDARFGVFLKKDTFSQAAALSFFRREGVSCIRRAADVPRPDAKKSP